MSIDRCSLVGQHWHVSSLCVKMHCHVKASVIIDQNIFGFSDFGASPSLSHKLGSADFSLSSCKPLEHCQCDIRSTEAMRLGSLLQEIVGVQRFRNSEAVML